MTSKEGDAGEAEVIKKVKCPNCGRKLMMLPRNYPMVDLQCTGCLFRAQVKTNFCKPKNEVFGAGWDIYQKVKKAGHLMPPLIINFKWQEKGSEKQAIWFYPFVPAANLRRRVLSSKARRAGYRMFNYTGVLKLPHFILYEK